MLPLNSTEKLMAENDDGGDSGEDERNLAHEVYLENTAARGVTLL